MDVNQTNPLAPIHPDSRQNHHGQEQGKDQPPSHHEAKNNKDIISGSWRDLDAVDFDHGLIDALTPEVQNIIDTLNQEIEPLRHQLEWAEQRTEELKRATTQHAFLDIPNRLEMLRELEHVIAYKAQLSMPPVLVLVHITNADPIRRQHGRKALDSYLSEICHRISGLIKPTDSFGSLGGNDFALIFLGVNLAQAKADIEELVSKTTENPVLIKDSDIEIELLSGAIDLAGIDSAETALIEADRQICT